jgi:hypothetical protein
MSRDSITGRVKKFVSIPRRPDRLWRPSSLLYNWYRKCFPGGKKQKREADHSCLSRDDVKNRGAIPPVLQASSFCGGHLAKKKRGG